VVYGTDPIRPLDLAPKVQVNKLNVEANKRVKEIQKLHKQVATKIEKSNASYHAQPNKPIKKVIF